ncbi:hypothetical protein [Liquorilactobacillus sicerae]|uniref:hypothetical protein n=1 Tax=Liquorilactobacillus sicerae TaxID=1416943 RepID=UPI00248139A9|nr:hypothetical protein [Liquorilactobacillus sicerae]
MITKFNQLNFWPKVLIGYLTIAVLSNCFFKNSLSQSLILLIGLTWLIALFKFFQPALDKISQKHLNCLLIISLFLTVILQSWILIRFPVSVYHDPYRVLTAAERLATGDHNWQQSTYFERYPNNIPLTFLLSLWFKLTFKFHLTTNFSLGFLNLVCLDTLIISIILMLKKLAARNSLIIASLTFLIFTPFAYSYYLQIFYSDLPAMLGLMIIFQILLSWKKTHIAQKLWLALSLFITVLISQLIKPSLIVILPATLLYILILKQQKLLKNSRLLTPLIIITLAICMSFPTAKIIEQAVAFQPETKSELPVESWILMGLNQHSHGTYDAALIAQEIKMPTKAARQKKDLKQIKAQIHRLKMVGLFKQWFIKASILLNVRSFLAWYNGGLRSANANIWNWQKLATVSYQLANILLAAVVFLRLLSWQPQLDSANERIALFAVIVALGLLSFNTFLWETEARYGQITLPLNFLLLGTIPFKKAKFSKIQIKKALLTSIIILLGISGSNWSKLKSSNTASQIVTAQRSQLSSQYNSPTYDLKANDCIKQRISFTHQVNLFWLEMPKTSNIIGWLMNDNHHYSLIRQGKHFGVNKIIAPGNYLLILKNPTNKIQKIDLARNINYQLAAYPLQINQKTDHYASLIYQALYVSR